MQFYISDRGDERNQGEEREHARADLGVLSNDQEIGKTKKNFETKTIKSVKEVSS